MKFWLNKINKLNKSNKSTSYLIIWLVVLILARIPSLFDVLRGVDEDYYMVVAQSLASGGKLYIDIWDNKPPLLYLVYLINYILIGPSLFGVRLFGLCLSVLSLVRFKQILELEIFNLSKARVLIVFSFVAFLISFGWQTVTFNAENLFLPLIIFGTYYLLKNISTKDFNSQLATGNYYKALVWFSFAGFVKFNSLIEVLILVIIYVLIIQKNQVIQSFTKENILLGLKGLLIIITPYLGLILIYLYWNKMNELYFGIFGFGGNYVSGNYLSFDAINFKISYLSLRVISYLIFVTTSIFLFFKNKLSDLQFWIFNLFAIEVFAILLSGRGYHHYLIQGFLGIGLILALCLKGKQQILKIGLTSVAIFLFLTVFLSRIDIWNGFGTDTNYGLFTKAITGQTTIYEWQLDNRDSAQLSEKIVPIIQNYTRSNDKIYLFTNTPFIYASSNRLPAYSYPVEYQYHEPLEQVYSKILNNQAKLIILDNKLESYSKYKELVQKNYILDQIINSEWEIYLPINTK